LPGEGPAEVTIRYGAVPDSLEDIQQQGVCYQVNAEAFLLKLNAIAKYLVTAGEQIIIEPVPRVQDGEVRLFLLGSAFAALLQQRGLLALHGCAVEVKDGAAVIVGPSGCGKSTHIRIYNRIYELYGDQRASGEILLDGQNILDPSYDVMELRRRVGMIFQKPTPFPMSVFDNVAYGLKMHYRLGRGELADRVEEALSRAALWDEVKDVLRKPGTALSGGQQQRLCIARALAVEPDVLLMDEPTSAIDPIATSRIEKLINDLRSTYTIVIVTHNLQQAARVSDFTAFFYQGRIVEFGSTQKIFTTPENEQTEAYITGRFG
jgi:phosphate transport system ATP-binding protein